MKDLGYETITRAMDAWHTARMLSSDEELGNRIVQRFFVLQPEGRHAIADPKKHGQTLVKSFDSIFQLLGPDIDILEDVCHQVGHRHAKLGVKSCYFVYMGQSLLHELQATLGERFTPEDRNAVREIYTTLSEEITRAIAD